MALNSKPTCSWEVTVTDAIGNVIEFWGFKHNHGRIWALLYVYDRPFSALEIQEALNLSKGSVSMMVRELVTWKVLHRIRSSDKTSWCFIAETNLTRMITNVIYQRETDIVLRMENQLSKAIQEAEEEKIDGEIRTRIKTLHNTAILFQEVLSIFLSKDNNALMPFLELLRELKNTLSEHE